MAYCENTLKTMYPDYVRVAIPLKHFRVSVPPSKGGTLSIKKFLF